MTWIPTAFRPAPTVPPHAIQAANAVRHAWRTHLLIVLGFLAIAALCLPYDIAFSQWFFRTLNGKPAWMRNFVDNLVGFGHGVGVGIIVLLVFILETRQRKAWISVLSTAFCAGMAANLGKLMIARWRPRDYKIVPEHFSETFRGFLPFLSNGTGGQSMPSAHTATAVGLAVILSTVYPRAKYVFAFLALNVAVHRLSYGAHHLSDVFVGAALGWGVGQICRWSALRYHYAEPAGAVAPMETALQK